MKCFKCGSDKHLKANCDKRGGGGGGSFKPPPGAQPGGEAPMFHAEESSTEPWGFTGNQDNYRPNAWEAYPAQQALGPGRARVQAINSDDPLAPLWANPPVLDIPSAHAYPIYNNTSGADSRQTHNTPASSARGTPRHSDRGQDLWDTQSRSHDPWDAQNLAPPTAEQPQLLPPPSFGALQHQQAPADWSHFQPTHIGSQPTQSGPPVQSPFGTTQGRNGTRAHQQPPPATNPWTNRYERNQAAEATVQVITEQAAAAALVMSQQVLQRPPEAATMAPEALNGQWLTNAARGGTNATVQIPKIASSWLMPPTLAYDQANSTRTPSGTGLSRAEKEDMLRATIMSRKQQPPSTERVPNFDNSCEDAIMSINRSSLHRTHAAGSGATGTSMASNGYKTDRQAFQQHVEAGADEEEDWTDPTIPSGEASQVPPRGPSTIPSGGPPAAPTPFRPDPNLSQVNEMRMRQEIQHLGRTQGGFTAEQEQYIANMEQRLLEEVIKRSASEAGANQRPPASRPRTLARGTGAASTSPSDFRPEQRSPQDDARSNPSVWSCPITPRVQQIVAMPLTQDALPTVPVLVGQAPVGSLDMVSVKRAYLRQLEDQLKDVVYAGPANHELQCCICQDNYREGELCVRRKCGHMFHRVCHGQACQRATDDGSGQVISIPCPICRAQVPEIAIWNYVDPELITQYTPGTHRTQQVQNLLPQTEHLGSGHAVTHAVEMQLRTPASMVTDQGVRIGNRFTGSH